MKNCCKPLYHKYPGQIDCQQAHIYASETGNIYANYDANIGGGCPADVYSRIRLRWRIDPRFATTTDIDNIIEYIKPLAKKIFENSKIINNDKRILSQHAIELVQEIAEDLENWAYADWEHCGDDDCVACNED